MTALAADGLEPRKKFFREISLPCAASTTFYRNGMICFDVSDVSAAPAGAGTDTDTFPVGLALTAPDNSAGAKGAKKVLVDLAQPVECIGFVNDGGGGALTAANLLSIVYFLDDRTVTSTTTNNAKAGRLWEIDGEGTCFVEMLRPAP